LGCAAQASATEPWRADAISTLEPRVRASLDIPGLLADDRSGLYEARIQLREEAHDQAAVKQLAAQWLAFLENSAASAPTVEGRAAFDSHRLLAARKLGDVGRVIPALQASERDLPEDYNPSVRLAIAYRELGRYEEALASAKRALAKAYGPRRVGVFETTASIYERKKDPEGARRTLEEALQYAETLPKAQRPEKTIQRLRVSLSQVGQAR
jgi:tetratricopeptide (TPR) repeat protein